jgi:hypothetical protein
MRRRIPPVALALSRLLWPASVAATPGDANGPWPALGAVVEAELRHQAPGPGNAPAESRGGASIELSLSKRLGPYLRADAHGVASLAGVDLLEAHVGAALPSLRVAARAGLLRHRVGVQNEWHPHDGVLIARPLALLRTFGEKGGRALGGEISLRPLDGPMDRWTGRGRRGAAGPFSLEVLAAVTDASGGETAASFFAGDPPPALRGPGDVLYLIAVKPSASANGLVLALGLSAMLGPNATGRDNRTDVLAADLRAELQRAGFSLWLLGEWFWRRRQVPGALAEDWTGYVEAQAHLRLGAPETGRALRFALRYEHATPGQSQRQGAGPGQGPAWPAHRAALGLLGQITDWALLRAQGSIDVTDGGAPGFGVQIAVQGRMGRHEDR